MHEVSDGRYNETLRLYERSVTGINHVVFHTNNMEKTAEFYCDILGFKVKVSYSPPREWTPNMQRLYFFEAPDGSNIAFEEITDPIEPEAPFVADQLWECVGRPEKAQAARQFNHLCFNVRKASDLPALRDAIVESGLWCSDIRKTPSTPYIHSFYLYDPNWIPIEFGTFYDPIADGLPDEWLSDPNPAHRSLPKLQG